MSDTLIQLDDFRRRPWSLDSGKGVDNIDYSDTGKLVYAAAADAAQLTIARSGKLIAFAVVPTARGMPVLVLGRLCVHI